MREQEKEASTDRQNKCTPNPSSVLVLGSLDDPKAVKKEASQFLPGWSWGSLSSIPGPTIPASLVPYCFPHLHPRWIPMATTHHLLPSPFLLRQHYRALPLSLTLAVQKGKGGDESAFAPRRVEGRGEEVRHAGAAAKK